MHLHDRCVLVLLQKIAIVPEDVSLLMTSFTNTLSSLSVKQGKYGLCIGKAREGLETQGDEKGL